MQRIIFLFVTAAGLSQPCWSQVVMSRLLILLIIGLATTQAWSHHGGIFSPMQYDKTNLSQENELLRFSPFGGDSQVEISWETRNENNLAGFILLRSEEDSSGTFAEIVSFTQDSALVGRGTEGLFSRRYVWTDRNVVNGTTYWYKLKTVTQSGEEKIQPPVSATPAAGLVIYQSAENLGWEWQNPLPAGNRLWDVDFVDANHGWMVGEHGTILRTIDGGRSWKFLDAGVKVESGGWLTEVHFRQVRFFDIMNGVIGGYIILGTDDAAGEQIILRTTDGGETWKITFRFRNLSANRWLDMFFLDSNHGWLFVDSHGTFGTFDGGFTWTKVGNVPPPFSTGGGATVIPTGLFRLFFTTPDTGWGALQSETVYYTTDGGKNWIRKIVPGLGLTNDIFFIDKQTGWMVDEIGQIFQTTDAGINWKLQQSLGPAFYLHRIRFVNRLAGFLSAYQIGRPDQGIIFKTNDGGEIWVRQDEKSGILFSGFDAADEQNFWIAGANVSDAPSNFPGLVLHSEDRGDTWKVLNQGFLTHIRDLQFVDLDRGWVLGSHQDSLRQQRTALLHTANGGRTWQMQTVFPADGPRELFMIDASRGWIITGAYNSGLQRLEWSIYRTSDGWASWQQTTFTNNDLIDVRFIDFLHGWAAGAKGLLLWTEDGGNSWQQGQLAIPDREFIDVERLHFINNRHGWAAGWNGRQFPFYGVFLETQDGGRTWQQVWKGEERRIRDFVFTDSSRGWATANQNLIFHTMDGGRHWEAQDPGLPFHELLCITFSDSMLGWALSNYGQVIYTTDGGNNWQKQQRVTDGLTTIFFVDPAHGWIAGGQGKILATVQGGLPLSQLTEVGQPKHRQTLASFTLYQNYPNPFNPSTKIRYDLSENSKVVLKIFNILGQETRTIVDEKLEMAGQHIVFWDGRDNHGNHVVSGIYFYRLETSKSARIRKMTLLR